MSQSNDGGSKKPSLVEKFSITTDEAKQLSVVNLLMSEEGQLNGAVLSDGSLLGGIKEGQANLMMDNNTVVLAVALEGQFTINGRKAFDVFTEVRAKRVREMLGQVVMPEPKKIVVVDR